MFCSNCGKENNKDSRYCFNCGNKLEIYKIKEDKKSGNQETSLILGIICLVSSFFLNIICFIPGIISIVYAKKYKKESGKLGVGFGLSIGGMIFSFITLILIILVSIFIINVAEQTIKDIDYNYDYNYSENLDNLSKI